MAAAATIKLASENRAADFPNREEVRAVTQEEPDRIRPIQKKTFQIAHRSAPEKRSEIGTIEHHKSEKIGGETRRIAFGDFNRFQTITQIFRVPVIGSTHQVRDFSGQRAQKVPLELLTGRGQNGKNQPRVASAPPIAGTRGGAHASNTLALSRR
ncbi:MAG: hypothetical protein U5K69_09345 [Balneolaceae bacterium]|nr:hypothetical protein [Balneolaceae bacterium]